MSLFFSVTKALSTLIRFQTKTELFCSVFKKIWVHTYRFRIVFARLTTTPYPFWKRFYTLNARAQMNLTHAHFSISAREIGAKLNPHDSVIPSFWIVTVERSGARSCLFWWRHRFQIASFSSNLVPRVLSLPRESTLVAAGHVPMYTNQIPIGGGSLT